MKPPEGARLDAAVDLFHDHAWRGQKPVLSVEQIAELLPVWAGWFWEEFAPTRRVERPKPDRPKNRNAPVDRGSQSEGRTLVYGRSGGSCEAWIPDVCTYMAREWHHRLNRSQGGRWDASNGLHLCPACHDYVTNRGREHAKREGWAVAPGVTPPADVPVLRRGELVLLMDDGSYEPYEEVA